MLCHSCIYSLICCPQVAKKINYGTFNQIETEFVFYTVFVIGDQLKASLSDHASLLLVLPGKLSLWKL